MVVDWIADEIKAFGRLLELSSFALNGRGLAAVQFENGVKLRLEYRHPALWVQVLIAMPADAEALIRLLSETHPRRGVTAAGIVRAGYLERSGEALLTIALSSDRIEASEIDAAFRELFERAVRLGRMS